MIKKEFNQSEVVLEMGSEDDKFVDYKSDINGWSFTWESVTYQVTGKDGQEKTLLNNVTGLVSSGRISALMGPSGSG